MPEVPPNPETKPNPDPNLAAPPNKFAGKYDTPQDLEKGYGELHAKLGLPALPDKKPLFGAGGIYTDVAAAELGYKSLETLAGRLPAPPAPGVTPAAKPAALAIPDAGDDADVEAVLKRAGVDGATLADQWKTGGKLADDAYAKLKAAGYPKPVVNAFMEARAAQAAAGQIVSTQIVAEAAKLAGGEQQLDTLLKFGATLGADRVTDLNRRLGDPKLWKGAVAEITSEYQTAAGAGTVQPLINGSAPSPTGAGFTTLKEFQDASDRVRRGNATAADKARLSATEFDSAIFKL